MTDVARDTGPSAGRSPHALFEVRCDRPLLVATFREPQSVLSWAVARPGFQAAREVAWLEVHEAELPVGVDHGELLAGRLSAAGLDGAVAMMTSRDVRRWRLASARAGDVSASCLATVGLANAARVGASVARPRRGPGTINLLAAVSARLSEAALVEAVSIAAEARTAAIIDAAWRTEGGGVATGTGTDCVVVAAPAGGRRTEAFAGLHTRVGEALGTAVYDAVRTGAEGWITERDRRPAAGAVGVRGGLTDPGVGTP